MGREIRKVKKGWEHPKDDNGNWHPMRNEYYGDAIAEWFKNHKLWLEGNHPDQIKNPEYKTKYLFYAQWDGNPPELEYYRRENWTETEACCFQMYENVSEGTPVSPVFETLIELEDWIVANLGYSRHAAHAFCEDGYAPSMIMCGGVVKDGIAAHDGFE